MHPQLLTQINRQVEIRYSLPSFSLLFFVAAYLLTLTYSSASFAQSITPAQCSPFQSAALNDAKDMARRGFRFYQMTKYAEAVSLLEGALKIQQQILGNNHSDVASTMDSLAKVYYSQKQYREAEQLQREAGRIRHYLSGGKSPTDMPINFDKLASQLHYEKNYIQAEKFYRLGLELRQHRLGKDHPDVAISLNLLAVLYEDMGRYQESEHFYKEALELRKNSLGYNHPLVIAALENLANLYVSLGLYDKAKPLFKEARETYLRLANNYPNEATYLDSLANIYMKQGQFLKSEALYKQAQKIRVNTEDTQAIVAPPLKLVTYPVEMLPHVTVGYSNLMELYISQNRYSEAKTISKYFSDFRKDFLIKDDPDKAIFHYYIAYLSHNKRTVDRAVKRNRSRG